jgi:ferredoxin-type protein NapH
MSFGPLELLDPAEALGVLVSRGATLRLLLSALPALVLVLLLGRFFCGWICPYVPILATSNAARSLLRRFGLRPLDLELPERLHVAVLVGVLAASAMAGAEWMPLLYPPAVIGREVWRAMFEGGLGAGAGVLLGLFAFDTLLVRAGTCRHLCPGGAMFALLSRASPVAIERRREACTDCAACDVVCNLLQSPMQDRVGAGCERCGKCVAVCPTDALSIGLRRRPGRERG